MNQADHHQRMEIGAHAAIALSIISEPIQELRESIISDIISRYRGRDVDHNSLIGAVAELAALDKLTTLLQSKQRQGEISAEKELTNAERY